MTSYIQGTRLEYDLMKLFRDKGYYVDRSAGSHGLSDLIVITKKKILLKAKKHEKLREQESEEELCSLAKTKNKIIEVYSAGIVRNDLEKSFCRI